MPREFHPGRFAGALAALACSLCLPALRAASADDAVLASAVCSIVYPVDQTPSGRGLRYAFYGNGFFINEQGYLVTAAHVLGPFRSGQPYILLAPPAGPARFVRANVVALDRDHDVAVLHAVPNPFESGYKVRFLPLAPASLAPGRAILTAARHPPDPLHSYTSDSFVDDRPSGQVFGFQFSRLYKGASETELVLFTPQVRRGQSGAPVVSRDSGEVAGFVEGQWLHSSVIQLAAAGDNNVPGVGAAVPVHYVIALLQQNGISWRSSAAAPMPTAGSTPGNAAYSPPVPLSLVASPFPPQALFGGEVLLDALVDSRGRLSETRTVRGESPFLENALAAVRTWSFFPARLAGQPVGARIGIIFQFAESYEPMRAPRPPSGGEPLSNSPDRGALPAVTGEPHFAPATARDGNAILSGLVRPDGQLGSLEVLEDSESLGPAAVAAVRNWRFAPGRRAGTPSESLAIVVVVFRYSGSATAAPGPRP